MIDLFGDRAGGFFMTSRDGETLILRPKDIYDGALPSGNSVAFLSLLKLHALTSKDLYLSQVEALFQGIGETVAQAPWAYGFFLSALDWHLQGALEVTFQAPQAHDDMIAKMLKVLYKHFVPSKAVKFVSGLVAPQAQICRRGVCQMPARTVNDFEKGLF
jgi:uncharacterized protein YyaL (SSP411 family)